MDNLCHALVGAALGEAGLKRRASLGNATLVISANLPDLDALVFLSDIPSVAFRRGWTHGVVAQAVLPVLLASAMLQIDRVIARRRGRAPAARWGPLLLLSYIGLYSHVFLDYLNNYGVRLLMPFSNTWFYGDAVFIVDPWLWLATGTGVVWARRWRTPYPARMALVLAGTYIAAMMWSAHAARARVENAWTMTYAAPPQSLMVGPVFLNPFRKAIIVNAGDHYRTGGFAWWPRDVHFDVRRIPRNADHPAVARARDAPDIRAILVWARFPYYEIEPASGSTRVTLQDVRFGNRVGAASVIVH